MLHHVVPVERRTHGVEVLFHGQTGDALLQLILGRRELLRLEQVRRRAIGPRELVEPVEERPGVPHVATDGAV
jgi:hypothetical protein